MGRTFRFAPTSNEGLATVVVPGRPPRLVYRGSRSIPASLRREGWVHIGDPDSHAGLVFDPYQGATGATAKMFAITEPGGRRRQYRHRLTVGEMLNNSFAAVSPDGRWLVSGEWGELTRLLVFPAPAGGPAPSGSEEDLPLAAVLHLDHPVRNMQGAAFEDATTLLCSTDDPSTDLWPVPRQLLEVRLERPIDGGPVEGKVTCLGALPLRSACRGTFEVEGIDYDRDSGDLRVVIVPPAPCGWLVAQVVRFRRL